MKPNPFSALNHFTVPVAILLFSFRSFIRATPTAEAARRGHRPLPKVPSDQMALSIQDLRGTATAIHDSSARNRVKTVFPVDVINRYSIFHPRLRLKPETVEVFLTRRLGICPRVKPLRTGLPAGSTCHRQTVNGHAISTLSCSAGLPRPATITP